MNPLYLIINKVDGYIEERIGNKYLTVVFNDKNQDTLKKYTELWDKIKELISLVTNTSGDYDRKWMKIKFSSDDNLPLNKILKLHNLFYLFYLFSNFLTWVCVWIVNVRIWYDWCIWRNWY